MAELPSRAKMSDREALTAEYIRRATELLTEQWNRYEDLLGAIWLYIPWHYVTKQLTTGQKELFADAVDAHSARINAEEPETGLHPAERWWRDG